MRLLRGRASSALLESKQTNVALSAGQTSLFLKLSRDWMLICVSFILSCFTKPDSALPSE